MAVYDALSNGGKEATNPIGGVKQKKQEEAERDNPTVDDYSTALGYSKEEDPLKYASAKDLLDANVTQTVTKELAMKNLNSQLNRAGLGNSGYAGIANANILNDYQAALQKNSSEYADRNLQLDQEAQGDVGGIADLIIQNMGNYADREDLYKYLEGYGLTMGENGLESNGTYDFTNMLMNEINAAYNQRFGNAASTTYQSVDDLKAALQTFNVESETLFKAIGDETLKYGDYVKVTNESGQTQYFKILDNGVVKPVSSSVYDSASADKKYEINGRNDIAKASEKTESKTEESSSKKEEEAENNGVIVDTVINAYNAGKTAKAIPEAAKQGFVSFFEELRKWLLGSAE